MAGLRAAMEFRRTYCYGGGGRMMGTDTQRKEITNKAVFRFCEDKIIIYIAII